MISQDQFDVFYPLYIFLKFFGLFPKFYEKTAKSRTFNFTIRDKFWLVVVLMVHIFCLIQSCYEYLEKDKLSLAEKTWQINSIFIFLVNIVCLFYCNSKYENFKAFLELCCEFDLKVKYFYFVIKINFKNFYENFAGQKT